MKKLLALFIVVFLAFSAGCDRFGRPKTFEDIAADLAGPPPQNMAVIVGINTYPGCPLRGCVNDAVNMKNYLIKNRIFKESEICMLTDDGATKERIMAALEAMVSKSSRGSRLYFHYSGHGTQVAATDPREEDGFYEAICPVDFAWAEDGTAPTGITDKELVAIFRKIPAGAIFRWSSDSCHSGDLTRDITPPTIAGRIMAKVRAFPIPAKVAAKLRLARAENPQTKTKELVDDILDVGYVSGCRSDQTSADASFAGVPEGAFTHFMLQALKREPKATAKQLVGMMQRDLKLAGFEQRPQAEGARIKDIFLPQ